MTKAFIHHQNALVLCLSQYQFIEESLRFCLIRCHATTKFRLDGYLSYDIPLPAIEDAALGRLTEWYKPYAKDQSVIADLRKIKDERDRIAHVGLLLTLKEQFNEPLLEQKALELEQSHERANACFLKLLAEMTHTDAAVNNAYEKLKSEYEARNAEPPKPFEDRVPKKKRG